MEGVVIGGTWSSRSSRDLQRRFWRAVGTGLTRYEAAAAVGVSSSVGYRLFVDGGGMPPLDLHEPSGRYLSLPEREEIAIGLASGESLRSIAARLGRAPSTISREARRNSPREHAGRRAWRRGYRATAAQAQAEDRARRPKPGKLVSHPPLREYVQAKLAGNGHWSPEQIARRLPVEFPDDERMRVTHETVYKALYVQGRGALRRELTACLRTGRALRKPRRRPDERRGRIKDMVLISERPAEVRDRAVPGHWEGDLIQGANRESAIGTLVERSTRLTMLLHLPDQKAASVRDAITSTVAALPGHLRRSLTWDQGHELAEHLQLRLDADLEVYFCDPHSPWQRGTNDNTTGLLRQYFPNGADLSAHSPQDLATVPAALNVRPRTTRAL